MLASLFNCVVYLGRDIVKALFHFVECQYLFKLCGPLSVHTSWRDMSFHRMPIFFSNCSMSGNIGQTSTKRRPILTKVWQKLTKYQPNVGQIKPNLQISTKSTTTSQNDSFTFKLSLVRDILKALCHIVECQYFLKLCGPLSVHIS